MKMKISTKGRYAIKFMIDLATYDNGEPVRIKDVAKRQWTDIIQSLYLYNACNHVRPDSVGNSVLLLQHQQIQL